MELKFIFTGFIFFILFGFIISLIAGYSPADSSEAYFNEIQEEFSGITGIVITGVLSFGIFLFGIFGINIIAGFYLLPVVINLMISSVGLLLMITFILWIWEKIVP